MIRKFLLILAVVIILSSCNNTKNNAINDKNTVIVSDTTKINLPFYEITNETLRHEIEMYMDSANSYSYVKKIYYICKK